MEKEVKCFHCGAEKKLVGQGLCCACYHRERRKRLAGGASAVQGQKEDFTISVDFAPMAFLLEELKKGLERSSGTLAARFSGNSIKALELEHVDPEKLERSRSRPGEDRPAGPSNI